MARCGATKKNGERCGLDSRYSDGKCWAHSTQTAQRRKEGNARGGRNRSGMARLAEIDKVLAEIASGVLDGSLDRANAAVAVMAHNARIRLTGVELSVKEQEIVQTGLAELQERWAEEMRSRGMDTPGHGQGPGGYRG